MTDEHIIEALEWCTYLDDCVNCPYYKKDCNCATIALDLIYRQKAEIERLEKELHLAKVEISKHFDYLDGAANEAVKEFAERLKEELRFNENCNFNCYDCFYKCKDYIPAIDKLVKEMTEDRNGQA